MNKCKECGIEIPKGRKFCGSSHAAIFNNKKFPKRTKGRTKPKCLNCGKELNKYEKKYCDNVCQQDYAYNNFIKKWLIGEETGNTGELGIWISAHVRRWLIERSGGKCEKCGWNTINEFTNKIPLQISHKDGDWRRTTPDNIEYICPNCHSLEKPVKMGNGRRVVYQKHRFNEKTGV